MPHSPEEAAMEIAGMHRTDIPAEALQGDVIDWSKVPHRLTDYATPERRMGDDRRYDRGGRHYFDDRRAALNRRGNGKSISEAHHDWKKPGAYVVSVHHERRKGERRTTMRQVRKEPNGDWHERTDRRRTVAHYAEQAAHAKALERVRELEAELTQTKLRYQWAANELLACDYGDNGREGEIGWLVYGWRKDTWRADHIDAWRIYGPSIDAAIDAALRSAK